MSRTTALPDPEGVAARAKEIHMALRADEEYPAFVAASLKYDADWTCFSGTPIISRYNQETDKTPLLEEGLRALCLKVAVFEMTGDENTAEIPIAIPVDEMTHAMIAQPQLLARITGRIGVQIIHQTDQEHTDFRAGDYTHQVYHLALGHPSPALLDRRGGSAATAFHPREEVRGSGLLEHGAGSCHRVRGPGLRITAS